MIKLSTTSGDETQGLGRRLAAALRPGDVVLLHGDLGAGKTTLTQGIAAGLGLPGPIQSPTFTLAAEHRGGTVPLAHLDLYRLSGEGELDGIGFGDYARPTDGITVIEWPERAGGSLPDRYLLVEIEHAGPDARRLDLSVVPPDDPLAARIQALQLDQ